MWWWLQLIIFPCIRGCPNILGYQHSTVSLYTSYLLQPDVTAVQTHKHTCAAVLIMNCNIALLGLCLSSAVAARLGASQFLVDSEKNKIVDTQGRERFFHGTNVVYKTDPFIPVIDHFDAKESFSVEDADLLASMGFNTIRLGVLWAGLEPVEGEYNMTYLDMVEEIVVMAGERGIYSLLDMHQDAFNAKYCGNGVPDWAAKPLIENFPYPLQVKSVSF